MSVTRPRPAGTTLHVRAALLNLCEGCTEYVASAIDQDRILQFVTEVV